MRLKAVCIIEGKDPSAWRSVVYDAMMMGGRGGKAGSEGASAAAAEPGAGW